MAANGTYRLGGIAPGNYILRMDYNQTKQTYFAPAASPLVVTENNAQTINLQLTYPQLKGSVMTPRGIHLFPLTRTVPGWCCWMNRMMNTRWTLRETAATCWAEWRKATTRFALSPAEQTFPILLRSRRRSPCPIQCLLSGPHPGSQPDPSPTAGHGLSPRGTDSNNIDG